MGSLLLEKSVLFSEHCTTQIKKIHLVNKSLLLYVRGTFGQKVGMYVSVWSLGMELKCLLLAISFPQGLPSPPIRAQEGDFVNVGIKSR